MSCPLVRLVVLNYNGGDLVQRCIEHLEALDWPEDRLDLVVVDNDSSDGSQHALAARSRVRLVQSGRNIGFPANNLGLRDLVGVDYVGLINNDAFVEPGWLRPLVEALERAPDVGAVCPKIVLEPSFLDLWLDGPTFSPPDDGRALSARVSAITVDGVDRWRSTVWAEGCFPAERGGSGEPDFRWFGDKALLRVPAAGTGPAKVELTLTSATPRRIGLDGGAGRVEVEVGTSPTTVGVVVDGDRYDVINNVGSVLLAGGWGADRGFLEPDVGQFDDGQEVFAWCGAGVLMRASYLRQVGLFDERFFMYYEDIDLSWRGRAQGWRYRYVPASRVRHMHASTSVEGSAMFHHFVERNRLVMLTKNSPASLASSAALRYLASTMSYARRDILGPLIARRRPSFGLVRARLRSFAAYLRLLPHALTERRRLRSAQRVRDDVIMTWVMPR